MDLNLFCRIEVFGVYMLKDRLKRSVDYLRISITDKCNLKCMYCSPPDRDSVSPTEGDCVSPGHDLPSLDSLVLLAECAVELGIRKIRITGGEPLLRPGVTGFVESLGRLQGLEDLALTTNGTRIADLAGELKARGLKRVNISLDSLNPGKFSMITRGGDLNKVLGGVEATLNAGFASVRTNTVVMRGVNDDELSDLAALSIEKPVDVRLIELMPMGQDPGRFASAYVSSEEARAAIERDYRLVPAENTSSDGPAAYYRIPEAPGRIGFISPISRCFCQTCNRIRVTAEGDLLPCLAAGTRISLRALLREGNRDKLMAALEQAVWNKPAGHGWNSERLETQPMFMIGG